MKAIAYRNAGTIDRPDALVDVELDRPVPAGRDLLVEVRAISVNPVDYKIRGNVDPDGAWKVLGWDAVGRVVEAGESVEGFKVGDDVYYAGSLVRPGANSQFHLVDERIVGHKPTSLSDAEAAALPLTAITAWEMLFDRFDLTRKVPGSANAILIIGGAGGVASIAIQLVRALTDLTVIATASRPETRDWVMDLGAHHVTDHSKSLADEIKALGIGAPGFVFSTNGTADNLDAIVELIAPQGHFGLIDDPEALNVSAFKQKSVSTHWEFMFTRSMFETADMNEQGKLLDKVAELIDTGKIRTTLGEVMTPINAETLKEAHRKSEAGRVKGKIVLEGF
ncbi:zinc-binding alcohol dehydrogenase family protein [Aurantimonas coralicida]|uniref:zinc-binding alcohol dehydrogenase family protein n=1 Tax=Aurantimonas coralicida TaxID=182270 RepID=UPI001D18CBE5|nr:zinc-binding alcohol dehydrogenase family protein [Aurantimonas coralicida]MCC4297568.1 zinc-binding alcohol dehydrogenase family protein [Aurantimonas coralicida]MDE0922307.1 zinc-binding alcohol dehydrogenase family protein [Aurantimonas coralicida]